MYLFLFSAVPLCFFLFHELEKRRYAVKGFGFNFFCGSILSAIYCFVEFLVFTPYRLPEFSFSSNFSYFLVYGTLLPVALCVLLFFLIGKNSWSFKLLMLSDVLPAFYSVFLPYRVISSYETLDYFTLFILPLVLISSFIIFRRVSTFLILEKADLWKKILFGILSYLIFLFLPSIIEALYFVKAPLWLLILVEILLFLYTIGLFFLCRGDLSGTEEKLKNIYTYKSLKAAPKEKKAKASSEKGAEKTEPEKLQEAPEKKEAAAEPENAKLVTEEKKAEKKEPAKKKKNTNKKKKK